MKTISTLFNLSLLIICFFQSLYFQANAQNNWEYAGDYKVIIGLYNSQHFVVDDGNRDYKYTTDGGESFQNFGLSLSSPRSLSYVEYLSTDRMRAVVFVGSNYELYESTDGGSNFTKLSVILPLSMAPLNQPPKMVSFDESESLLSCRVLYNSELFDVLFRTTDGGSSWSLATADTFTFRQLYDIEIYKDGHVVAASRLPQGIEVSSDRGKTFTQTASFPPLTPFIEMAYDGDQNIWATNISGSQNEQSYVSADGGSSWNPWTAVPDGNDVQFMKPSTILIWGSDDTTSISTDGGSSFSTVSFPATKPAGSLLRLKIGGDQNTYYIFDGNAKLWTLNMGSGVGIDDLQNVNSINVYPNPTSQTLYIENYNGPVEVYSSSSKLLHSASLKRDEPVDLSDLPSGLLILKLGSNSYRVLKK